jgi:hypothetical protein
MHKDKGVAVTFIKEVFMFGKVGLHSVLSQVQKTWMKRCIILSFANFLHGATAPSGRGPPHYRGFTITLRHNTLGRTPLEK